MINKRAKYAYKFLPMTENDGQRQKKAKCDRQMDRWTNRQTDVAGHSRVHRLKRGGALNRGGR